MIPFIMGSVLCSLVGQGANVYCDPGVWELFEGKVVIVDVKWVMIAFIMGSGWGKMFIVTLVFENFSKGRLKTI